MLQISLFYKVFRVISGDFFGTELAKSQTLKRKLKMAGVAGLEPVTSAVTGQRSNQLSYTPTMGTWNLKKFSGGVKFCFGDLRL